MIRFDVSKEDAQIIDRLAERAARSFPERTRLDWEMDLRATHANGCPLDLAKLERADNFNFAHDLLGIAGHLDRDDASATAGRLTGCFLPRCHARRVGA